jgi:hypothetical protein
MGDGLRARKEGEIAEGQRHSNDSGKAPILTHRQGPMHAQFRGIFWPARPKEATLLVAIAARGDDLFPAPPVSQNS